MATLTCPGCGAAVSHDDLICFTCGTNLPRRGPVEEETAPPTVMQEYLRSGGGAAPGKAPATGPISPVVLRLAFPAGNVDVPAGTSLVLAGPRRVAGGGRLRQLRERVQAARHDHR
jgi:hypothetical protein